MKVYVARDSYAGADDDGSDFVFREDRVVLEDHWARLRWPGQWDLAGTVDAETARKIVMLDDKATLSLLFDRIQPEAYPDETHEEPANSARRPGRPAWTNVLFARRWREACERSGQPYTYRAVAPHFVFLDGDTRVDADAEYLGRLWRKHGRPGPVPE
jgi:hypothetical protein